MNTTSARDCLRNRFVVTFRDIPEAITQCDDLGDATDMANNALLTAMDLYFEDGRPVPNPSSPRKGEVLVGLPASVWAKVLLLNEMTTRRVRPADLARRLDIRPQEVTRLLNLKHLTKIDAVGSALHALGKRMIVAAV